MKKIAEDLAGIHPADEESTYLILQYLNKQKMDYSLLDLDVDFGKELAEYVKSCDPSNSPGYSS